MNMAQFYLNLSLSRWSWAFKPAGGHTKGAESKGGCDRQRHLVSASWKHKLPPSSEENESEGHQSCLLLFDFGKFTYWMFCWYRLWWSLTLPQASFSTCKDRSQSCRWPEGREMISDLYHLRLWYNLWGQGQTKDQRRQGEVIVLAVSSISKLLNKQKTTVLSSCLLEPNTAGKFKGSLLW